MKARPKILVATDFADVSEQATTYARELARGLGGDLVVLHVYEVPMLALPIEGAVVSPATWATDLSNRWQKKLDESAERQRGQGVAVMGLLRNGIVHEEVHRAADAQDADLIVIGTHGRTGASRMLLGSAAERILRTATRPVLTVSPKAS
jgi:nucleotide-binding universal stress UspA family protein